MGILNSISTEISRVYEQLGGNEAVRVMKPHEVQILNDDDEFEPFTYFTAGLAFGTLGAFLAISYKWIKELPITAAKAAFLIDKKNAVSELPVQPTPVGPLAPPGDAKAEVSAEAEPVPSPELVKNYQFGDRWGHRILGVFGILVGVFLALVVGGLISLFRVPKASVISGWKWFKATLGAAWGVSSAKLTQLFRDDNRHWFVKGLGLPGAILGAAIASPFAVGILTGRLVAEGWRIPKESWKSFKWVTRSILKAVSSEDSMFNVDIQTEPDLVKRFVFGSIGIVFGIIAAAIPAVSIVLARGVDNTRKAFLHDAKVLINAAFERHIFSGNLKFDNITRKGTNLKFGFLGVPLALILVGIPAIGIRATRVLTPIFLGVVFLVPSIVRRFIGETYKLVRGKQRFNENRKGPLSAPEFDELRNIFANNDPWTGKPDINVPYKAEGKHLTESGRAWINVQKFIRKVFTFNGQTFAEQFRTKVVANLTETNEEALPRLQRRIALKEAMLKELATTVNSGRAEGGKLGELYTRMDNIRQFGNPFQKHVRFYFLQSEYRDGVDRYNGLVNDLRLLRREAVARDPSNPNRTNDLIDITAKQIERKYKDKSTVIMSPVEKDSNNTILEGLSAFTKYRLSRVRPGPNGAASAPASAPPAEPEQPPRYEDVYGQAPSWFLGENLYVPSVPSIPAPPYVAPPENHTPGIN